MQVFGSAISIYQRPVTTPLQQSTVFLLDVCPPISQNAIVSSVFHLPLCILYIRQTTPSNAIWIELRVSLPLWTDMQTFYEIFICVEGRNEKVILLRDFSRRCMVSAGVPDCSCAFLFAKGVEVFEDFIDSLFHGERMLGTLGFQ